MTSAWSSTCRAPATKSRCTGVDLAQGRIINAANLTVRAARKIKMRHVSEVFQAVRNGVTQDGADMHWLEQLNAAQSMAQLVGVADRARTFNQWNERLAGQARLVAAELRNTASVMGS